MEQTIMDDTGTVLYVLMVNGVKISAPFSDRMVAEMAKGNLPDEQKLLAEVVAVTNDGKQVLFG